MSKRKLSKSLSPVRSKILAKTKNQQSLSKFIVKAPSSSESDELASSADSTLIKRDFLKANATETTEGCGEDERNNVKALKCDNQWTNFRRENLSLDYIILYNRKKASELISRCESEIVYNVGHLARVRMFGKWIDIPRKQVAFGDAGLTYSFSGNTVPARPWIPLLLEMRNDISKMCGFEFNFVLINRYQDGNNYMGEHKDDEKDLCPNHPIASLSLGQQRDFYFKHQDCRGKNAKRKIDKLMLQLENGSLLMMNSPTNSFWYHCLPRRPKVLGMRLNFTFRKMVPSKCKPVKNVGDES